MNPEISKLLNDIYKSITTIEEYLEGITTLSVYRNDIRTVDAVERRLSIIGEALWKADKKDKGLSISNKVRIISLRHIIIHNYDLVEDETIWIICKNDLPVLKKEVQLILGIEN